MIIGINYADNKFKKAQQLNTWSMYHKGKVDKVIEYGPNDLDPAFVEENKEILNKPRGAGYWLWKPYIIKKTFESLQSGDYLFYCDSGAVILKPVQLLISAMEKAKVNVMCFQLTSHLEERLYSKRDAFVLLNCDGEKYTKTPQRLATYMVIKKESKTNMPNNSIDAEKLLNDYLSFCKDRRIILNEPNVMGLPNYEGFVENRHDQTVWSLLTKKYGIPAFRDPSQWGKNEKLFPESTHKMSEYPVIIDSTRQKKLHTWSKYKLYCIFRKMLYLKHCLLETTK